MNKLTVENRWVARPRQESGRERYSEQETDYDKCHSIIARIEFRTAKEGGGGRDRKRKTERRGGGLEVSRVVSSEVCY